MTNGKIDRRNWLRLLAAGGAGAALSAVDGQAAAQKTARSANKKGGKDKGKKSRKFVTGRDTMPTLFVAHGAPPLLEDPVWMGELHAWAQALPIPTAVLMLSAHWENEPVTLGATTTVPLVYDFSGFPRHYYEMEYRAPGAPALADRVRDLLRKTQPVAQRPTRGLDHGAYVPMMAMYPEADIPVLQASLPSLDPRKLFELGQALAPLRKEGVLIVGSGFLTHNLRMMDLSARSQSPPQWAAEFDAWSAEVLKKRDVDALLAYRERAPGVEIALPTHEHFVPVVVAAGAAADAGEPVTFPITGFWAGSLTRRSVQFGAG